jgi:rubrerythrin
LGKHITRHLFWGTEKRSPGPYGEFYEAAALPADSENPYLDVYKAPRERAAYLLRIASEVEHALMAQYLFAAWSLGNPDLSPEQLDLARSWRTTILDIAREEMGHLATVQNLLTLIGAPQSFARDDYPSPSHIYPFRFELEPLTKVSLGKYVLSEMPSDEKLEALERKHKIEKGEIKAIRQFVRRSGYRGAATVHRVGKLYDAIASLFTSPEVFTELITTPPAAGPQKLKQYIATQDINADAVAFMVKPGEWKLGYEGLLIFAPADRTGALKAIEQISAQGEGSGLDDFDSSHFGRFLKIYRVFPDVSSWLPARLVARNPTTNAGNPGASQIRDGVAIRWAKLFNLRYRMLLMFLVHSFAVETPVSQSARTSRGLLISWAFGEMYHLRSIGEILMGLKIAEGSEEFAGPPFEMPYALELAPREPDRWRLHRDLILSSQRYVEELLLVKTGFETYLRGLKSADAVALEQAIAMVGA